jgi:gliding motility-associated-like protein
MRLVSNLKRAVFALAFFIPVLLFSQEVCNNGIDDDNDGLVDCYDPDCGGNAACSDFFFGQPENTSCQYPQPGSYTLITEWSTPPLSVYTFTTPVAGDIDNDGIVEVVAIKGYSGLPTDTIMVFNGSTGNLKFKAVAPAFTAFFGGSNGNTLALGDIDNDGFGEIIAVGGSTSLFAFEHDGTLKYTGGVAEGDYTPNLADFNQDGNPEIYVGRRIFNGQTGAVIGTGTGSRGIGTAAHNTVAADVLPTAFCADCAGLELIAGNQVYSVNIATGTITVQVTAAGGLIDGMTSLGDYDGDGDLDAIVSANNPAPNVSDVYVWDLQTSAQIGPTVSLAGGSASAGHCTVGDFDSDGLAEIGVAGLNNITVFDDHTTNLAVLWTETIPDASATTGSALFDFEGDGSIEFVHRAEDSLVIFRGNDGARIASIQCLAGTVTERPIIADVDGDGEAEICAVCAASTGTSEARMVTIAPAVKPWVSARKVWNQAANYVTHINDDLSVPIQQQDNAVIPVLNGYNFQSTLLDTAGNPTFEDFSGNPLYPAPDATVDITNLDFTNCGAAPNTIDVTVEVTNVSNDLDLPTGTPVALYNGNPFSPGATYISTIFTTGAITFNATETLSTTIPDQGGIFILAAVVNDSGTGTLPLTEPVFLAGECDFANNLDTADIVGCATIVANSAPVAVNDTAATTEDNAGINIDVLASDTDPDLPNDSLVTDTIMMQPPNGTATINPDGSINYVPDPNFNGTDSLQYVVCDTAGPLCDTAWVFINVSPVNDPPVAVADADTTDENTPVTIDVVANDSDPNDPAGNINPTTVDTIPGSGPANGSVTINTTTGEITYTPDPGFNGTDTFEYVVCDDGNPLPQQCDTATVTIVVNPVNDPPVAVNDSTTASEDTTGIDINVLASDTDPDLPNDSLVTDSILTQPPNGTASINPDGTINYVPDANFNGTDSLQYIVCDTAGPDCDTAWVFIDVAPVNDPPFAVTDRDTTVENSAVTIDVVANDSDSLDPLGGIDPTTVDTIAGSGPANGSVTINNTTGEIIYTPDSGFVGNDTLQYTVCDSGNPAPARCDTANIYIVVTPFNDPPVAVDDADTTNENTAVTIDVVANDNDTLDGALGGIDPATVDTIPGSGPANGSVTINNTTGEITYTPDPNFNGTDTFDYVVCDSGFPLPAKCDTATVTIVVDPVNNPPFAFDDTDSTDEDAPVIIDVVANDNDSLDPSGGIDPTTVDTIPGSGPANGSVTINGTTGEITYTPNPGFNGTDTFDYVVCDSGSPLPPECDTATVTITVNPVNDPPFAFNDSDTTDEDTPITVNVVANDNDSLDPLGGIDPATVDTISGSGPANGSVTINNTTGEITYTPDPGFNGTDTFDYVVCDSGNPLPALCDTATVTIVVEPVNNAPFAVDDNEVTDEETPVTVDVVANDSDSLDPLGGIDPTTVDTIPGSGPANGSVTINNTTGEITYTPDPGFNGTDTFDYVVCDSGNPLPALCDTATVTITVNPVNDQPVAVDDADTTDEDTPITVNVVANDDDPNDPLGNIDPATVDTIPGSGPANGSVTINNTTGEITYTPDPGFHGTDTFDYVVCDDGNPLPAQCDTATVTITVLPVNDQPVAVNDADTTDEDTPVTVDVVANDDDPNDPLGNIDPTTVDTIPGSGPANGSVTINNTTGEITYTPDPGFNGTDTFDYVVCDDGNPLPAQCDTATVTITVLPVNDQPVAVNDADTTDEDTPVTVDVVANDDDPNDPLGNIDPTTVDTIPGSGPANGSVTINNTTGEITYTPDAGFNGTDTFDYVVCDDGNPLPAQCDTATVTITVLPVNDQPVAVNDADTTDEDTPVTVDVVANDDDPNDPLGNIDPTTVDTIPGSGPANGSVTINNTTGEITYTPDPGFNGTDTFDYVVCDDGNPLPALCDTATVTITVNPVNDQPVAVNDADTTDENTPVTVDVVANDDDPNDPLGNIDPTTVDTIPGSGPANGSVTINNTTGEITYTPDPGFNGTDTFDYVVCDDGNPLPAQCDTATVTITVLPVNDQPVAVNDADTTDEDTPVTVDVVANDDDPNDPLGNIDPTTVDTIPGSGPANGSVTINNTTGEITYTPDPGFNGTDTFDYVVCDDGNPLPALCDTATVTITVNPVNDQPVAVNDADTTDENTAVTVDVVANDDDPNDPLGNIDPTTVDTIPGSGPANGSVTINNTTGEITYTPDPGFNGTDTFDYVVCDDGNPLPAQCDTATVTITVLPVNDQPVAVNDADTTDEDTAVTVDVVANDDDPNDPLGNIDPTTVDTIPGSGPANGSVTINNTTGEITYTPDPGFNGTDTFDYVVCDDGNPLPALCDTATVTITVNPVNDQPVAVNDADTTDEDTPITVDVVANDDDPNDPLGNIDPTTVDTIPGSGPANGSLTINNTTGEITYTPDAGFNGTDTFDYVVCDDGNPLPAQCDTATVTITVLPVNDPPVAVNDADTTDEDTPITVDVVANDDDPNDPLGNIDPTTVDTIPGSGPANGSVTINNATGEITYTPDPGFNGIDTFDYVVCDDGNPLPSQCDTATVTITVLPVNDPPVAVNDADTTDEETPVTIDVVANDNDSLDPLGGIDPASVDTIPGSGPANGTISIDPVTGEITYTPNANFNGTDTFDYVVCDSGNPLPALCDTATVTITVNPVNDPPLAVNDADTTNEETPVTVNVVANDSDSLDPLGNIDPTTVTVIPGSGPSNGSVTVDTATGAVTYTPDPNFNGIDTFDYVVCDDGNPLPSQCDTATVTITVLPVNDPPVAVNDADTTDEETPVTIDVVANDNDSLDPLGNIDPATVDTIPGSGPSNGTISIDPVTGEITYTPNANFNGTETFDYVVCDDGNPLPAQCDTATVTITVNPVNDPPLAVNDTDTTNEETPVTVDVVANDSDSLDPLGNIDPTTVTVIPGSGPANGSVTVDTATGAVTYTPDPNFNGIDTFDYVVCDDGNPLPSQCDTATVTITVLPVNDPPVAVNDADTTDEETPVTIDVVANDNDSLDPMGGIDPSSVDTIPGSGPANGTISIDPVTGAITYTPDPGFNGTDTFDYVVCDSGNPLPALCDTATVTITVNPVNDPPVAVNDADTTDEETPVTVNVVANDSDSLDPLGGIDPTTVDSIPGSGPSNGTISIDPVTGEITYTPDPNFNGMDTFDYVVCDSGNPLPSLCDTATVTIVVNPVNDPPVAVNDVDTTDEDTPVTIDVVANDNDSLDPLGGIDPASVDTIPGGGPSNGTVSIDPVTGAITYVPDSNFSGVDTLQYVVCDSGNPAPPLCDTATVFITVNPVNDPPVANTDMDTIPEDGAGIDINVLGNDTDPDLPNDSLVVTGITTPPANGTASINPDGSINYVPDPNFNGLDSLLYVVCDTATPPLCDTAWVYIWVAPVNDPPVAANDSTSMNNDSANVTIDVGVNDTDPDLPNDSLTVSATPCPPANGSVVINANGTLTYTPTPGYVGVDSFCYVICDAGMPPLCDTAWVYVDVLDGNNPPIAVDDDTTTTVGTEVFIPVTDNDFDPDGDGIYVSDVPCPPTNGVVFIVSADSVIYIPNADFIGVDTFCYVICDSVNPPQCDTAIVTVTVVSDNNPPVGVTDSVTTNQDQPVVIAALFNDDDPDGDSLTITAIPCPPANGMAVINPNGTITYTPGPGFQGQDSLCYVICDDGLPPLCDTIYVYIDVLGDDIVVIPNGFTPNDDGDNDFFVVKGLDPDKFPDASLLVFNRWGNIVFEAEGYLNDWGGENSKSNPLPDGSYYYILDLGDGSEPRVGFVLIFR